MPAMSKVERAFCCGALWRTGTGAVVRSLPTATLGHEVLEIGSPRSTGSTGHRSGCSAPTSSARAAPRSACGPRSRPDCGATC